MSPTLSITGSGLSITGTGFTYGLPLPVSSSSEGGGGGGGGGGGASDVEFVFGVGGEDKKNSSSWILKEWSQPTTERAWGRYTVLDNGTGWATKKLAFDAGKALSDQRHFHRSEHWHVVEGQIHMSLEYADGTKHNQIYNSGASIDIPVLTWHKASNVGEITAKVIEVWMGSKLTEEDIERRD